MSSKNNYSSHFIRRWNSRNPGTVLLLFYVLMIGLITGCYPSQQARKAEVEKILNSYLGKHKSDVIREIGPPSRYSSDGKGGEILIYEKASTSGVRGSYMYVERTNNTFIHFYADPNGVIYYWRYGSQ